MSAFDFFSRLTKGAFMAATNPVLFTPVSEDEVKLNRPGQEDLIKKLLQNINMLGELAVIGAVECFNINQLGANSPSVEIFQGADGSEITNSDSPLRSSGPTTRYTPDTRNRYVRGANGSTVIGNELGGAATVNLAHSHDPSGDYTSPLVGNAGTDGFGGPETHSHNTPSDLDSAEPLQVAHVQIAMYLKIN
jgi:hypothetical protein